MKEYDSEIVDTISRKLVPYILLFGLYLVSYGHLSPGGGFQGGVVLGSAAILFSLSRGVSASQKIFPLKRLALTESICFFLFILLGIGGILAGKFFLENFLPPGKSEEIPHAGFILFLNLIIGVKVGAGTTLVFFYLAGKKEEG